MAQDIQNNAAPQLTVRAIVTGMVLGALLTPCNIYSGLKIGWSFNMSIAAALLSFAFWKAATPLTGARPWSMLENNLNQTAASASASIISAGLVAPIPALTMLTGRQFTFDVLAVWVFVVSFLGVIVAVGLRRQMLEREKLPFPAGIATAETLREIYSRGGEALRRVQVLVSAGVLAAALKLFSQFVHTIPQLKTALRFTAPAALKAKGLTTISATSLGWVLDPSLLMIGFGAIIGIRAGISLLLGAAIAWGALGPYALAHGWAEAGTAGGYWFGPMVKWLLWPGVAMMVVASLTSFVLALVRAIRMRHPGAQAAATEAEIKAPLVSVATRWFVAGLVLAAILAAAGQYYIFGIGWFTALLAVALSFVLAIVAARVSGETGITPIGAMGKITQLSFAAVAPGSVTTNLMSANVTGGAAGQCADMMHDFKTGLLIGASPNLQAIAQVFGVLTGSLVGVATYMLLIPHPATMLITAQWPAPAVATWKAVAEVLRAGFADLPAGAVPAVAIAAIFGLVLAVAGHRLPPKWAARVPSPSAMGLAFVIPAWNSLSLFLGALIAWLVLRYRRDWGERFLIAAAAGLVAGESLAGVAAAMSALNAGWIK
jgi:putative OPT family oligopeptide transporter